LHGGAQYTANPAKSACDPTFGGFKNKCESIECSFLDAGAAELRLNRTLKPRIARAELSSNVFLSTIDAAALASLQDSCRTFMGSCSAGVRLRSGFVVRGERHADPHRCQ
jgi:hypothetical protein